MILAVAMAIKTITDAVTLAAAGNGSSYGIRSDNSSGNAVPLVVAGICSGWRAEAVAGCGNGKSNENGSGTGIGSGWQW